MSLIQNDHVIEQFAPDGSYQPLSVRVLPGRSGCPYHLFIGSNLRSHPDILVVQSANVSKLAHRPKV